jgi:hypothetical protein
MQALVRINAQDNSEFALHISPYDAFALTKVSDINIASNPKHALPPVLKKKILTALRGQAISAASIRTLGMLAAKDLQKDYATKLFETAEKISRRELLTQIMLIEAALASTEASKAIKHYDTMLRTSAVSRELLLPKLIAATGSPELLPLIAKVLNDGPEWRYEFYGQLMEKSPAIENVATLYQSLYGTKGSFHKAATADLINRLIEKKHFAIAQSIYEKVKLKSGKNILNFDRNADYQPFDWKFTNTAYIYTSLEKYEDDNKYSEHLYFQINDGGPKIIARKLVRLRPSYYTISAQTKEVSGAKFPDIYWTVTCVNGTELLNKAPITASGSGFLLPNSDCEAQWISISAITQLTEAAGTILDPKILTK